MDGQVTWSDLGLWSGKMCQELSAATKGKTSRQSSKRSSASQNRKPPILKCLKRDGTPGGATTMRWEDDGAWLGECMTRNTGESPNAAAVSRLSQILEVTPQEKYSLSAKACQGILRRAERRGKDLPELLKTVLLMQSESGGGCDGGGKGALVQTDKSGTLGTGNDQTIFTAISINGNVAGTLDANYYKGCGVRQGIEREVVASFSAIPINDKATRWQGSGESRNHDGSGNGLGIGKEGDPSPTLTAGDRHGVAYISGVDGYNGDLIGDVASTIGVNCGMSTGRSGVMELSANENGGMAQDSVLCAGFKLGNSEQARSIGYAEEQSPKLNAECGGNKPAVVALDMSHACDVIRDCMVVRRLTPMECERLQGFPDGWTDIGEWRDSKGKLRKPSDSPRYKALGNSIALPFWDFLAKRISAQYLRPVTMGSLFDGIGGFPLVFERHNGKGTARWASEIEEFPIAVTKLRFGED